MKEEQDWRIIQLTKAILVKMVATTPLRLALGAEDEKNGMDWIWI